MENMSYTQAIKDRCAVNLVAELIRETLEAGETNISLDRLNDVLFVAEGRVIMPSSLRELEVI